MADSRRSRRRFDDENFQPANTERDRSETDDIASSANLDRHHDAADPGDVIRTSKLGLPNFDDEVEGAEPSWSSYRQATKGPSPVPAWVVTDPRATDIDRGVLKTGKEADVSLFERGLDPLIDDPGTRLDAGPSASHCLLAVKQFRSAEHRMFHRDAGYLEGRRVKESREMRAMATRTTYGRALIASQWAVAEFFVLGILWSTGAAVPYPVQLLETELMMEFIGSPDGVAAPRLAALRPSLAEGRDLYGQLVDVLRLLARAGYAHGDLSAYNLLVHDGRLVMIDLPQAVDIVGNPQGFDFLRRDCVNICTWFSRRGIHEADPDDLLHILTRSLPHFRFDSK